MPSGKPTLRDVAKAAGVSPMTASNALHGKPGVKDSTRAKVLAVAEKLDYRINLTASMLKSGRSNIIHIIVNEFDSPFYSKLVESLATETTARADAVRGANPVLSGCRQTRAGQQPVLRAVVRRRDYPRFGPECRCAAFRDQPRPTAGSD